VAVAVSLLIVSRYFACMVARSPSVAAERDQSVDEKCGAN
jgi:hypothetical protein